MQTIRKKTVEVKVGTIGIGGNNPVRIQSMTNTKTNDVEETVNQIIELINAGSELVRFTVKDEADALAVPLIKKNLLSKGISTPLIGDFHYNGHILLQNNPECAKSLDKYRINPGNVGQDDNFKAFIELAKKYNKPVRIGVNFGSIDKKIYEKLIDQNSQLNVKKTSQEIAVLAMVESVEQSLNEALRYGLSKDKIILSVKASTVQEMVEANKLLSNKINSPLHLGVTEAGLGNKGIIASSSGLSILLNQGIGDTIRVSLTPLPNTPRSEEVMVAQQILQVLNIRKFMPTVTSCPGCGRTSSDEFQKITLKITNFLKEKTFEWKSLGYNGIENLTVAVMGCIVNGPGESKHANLGLSLPGDGEDPICPVYIDGKLAEKLQGENKTKYFMQIIENYVKSHYKINS